ncbi:MAG TPA: CDP-diacylglycerol--serine O-phosphatidyltransferase [Candidatus Limnocylindria bacterium]|nr:CDP-diacylglycerol--serine O-phosphatidyltransferase [Candidatus Limnocylindria bacterium]
MAEEQLPEAPEPKLRIYFLPNLFTAANLFCGFVALTKIVGAEIGTDVLNPDFTQIKIALGFILLACIFDLFDGRIARMAGVESPFGREFDSLADLVSFGVAPAFLVHRVVLRDVFINHPEWGWFISSLYLLAGAFRLARFNCLATMAGSGGGKEFLGFPIPAAAGLVSSLTYLMIHLDEHGNAPPKWRFALPVVLLFLSAMMISTVKYPTFKRFDLKATGTFWKTIMGAVFIGSVVVLRERVLYIVLPLLFTAYLLYGFIRPYISRKMQREIEEDEDTQESDDP